MNKYKLWQWEGTVFINPSGDDYRGVLVKNVNWAYPKCFYSKRETKWTAYLPLIVWDETIPSTKITPNYGWE